MCLKCFVRKLQTLMFTNTHFAISNFVTDLLNIKKVDTYTLGRDSQASIPRVQPCRLSLAGCMVVLRYTSSPESGYKKSKP